MQLNFGMNLLYTVAIWYTYKTYIPATQTFFLYLKHIKFVFFHKTFELLLGKLLPQTFACRLSFYDSDLNLSVASLESFPDHPF